MRGDALYRAVPARATCEAPLASPRCRRRPRRDSAALVLSIAFLSLAAPALGQDPETFDLSFGSIISTAILIAIASFLLQTVFIWMAARWLGLEGGVGSAIGALILGMIGSVIAGFLLGLVVAIALPQLLATGVAFSILAQAMYLAVFTVAVRWSYKADGTRAFLVVLIAWTLTSLVIVLCLQLFFGV